MDLKEQKYVCTLAECKSLTRASERLYISQPALSLYINNVEKILGARLFERNGRKFELTWLGKQYVEKASRRGYNLTHRSRPVCTEDFYHFDMIIGMDDRNIEDLMERAPDLETEKKIHRMTDYCRTKVADYVPDPYYGGAQGFENVLDILEDACAGLLTSLVPDN